MPKVDGLHLIKELQKQFPTISVIVHSGYDHFENAKVAMRYGVKYFCLKPATVSEIEEVMKEITQELDIIETEKKLYQQFNVEQKQYLNLSKKALIKDLLLNRLASISVTDEKLELLGMSKKMNVIVSTLSLFRPHYLRKSDEREWQLMKFSAENIMNETFERNMEEMDIYLIDTSDSSFSIVTMVNEPVQDFEECNQRLINELVQNILIYLKLSLQAGIGRIKDGIEGIYPSYLDSQKTLEAAEHQEINQIYTFDELHDQQLVQSNGYPFEWMLDIQLIIQKKDYKQLLAIWTSVENEWLKNNHPPLLFVQQICISIMSGLHMEIEELNRMNNMETMSDTVLKIYNQPSVNQLAMFMRQYLENWSMQTKEELTGGKSNRLIKQVKEYVHDYYDQEISLSEIANQLFVNKNYLSQLFKKVTGETFVTYLNHYRIDKAKEILKNNQWMVYEVSEMVGYQNSTYFSQVFKSITGISPSDYGNM
ncbi:putative response regulator [Bacillus sp. TS-2]|nr:putative response regulator [Bacillus sp. TS-2]